MKKPIIAVSMGDPCGIGPEIIVKALTDKTLANTITTIVIGDLNIIKKALVTTGVNLAINLVDQISDINPNPDTINLIDLHNVDLTTFKWGEVSAQGGAAAYDYIAKAIALAMNGEVSAVATAPINKESLRAAKVPYIGHTEIFAALCKVEDPLTMFETNGMRVFFLTRHVSLRKMLDMITQVRIIDYVERCTAALEKLGVNDGVMAVAGLNPHSGEHGLFGDEEVEIIAPAVLKLQKRGYQVEGPISADSVFHQCAIGTYNSVLSLYHDQGHIATKTLDFDKTIAITNGLPILRTSVDHGTAFDIAGQGKADAVSMKEAIILAAKYAKHFTNKENK